MGNSPLQFTTFKKCIEEIFRLNHIAHLKITSLPETNHGRSLTKRQREVLQWVADGKTIQDIATIMGLSLATIEKHLKLARDALNVETTAQAVMKASTNNQLFLFQDFEMPEH